MFSFIKSLFSDDNTLSSGLSVNVDGTSMMGSVDIHGHQFGVTDFDDSIHSCTDDMFNNGSSICDDNHSSMFDDTFSSCGSSMFD